MSKRFIQRTARRIAAVVIAWGMLSAMAASPEVLAAKETQQEGGFLYSYAASSADSTYWDKFQSRYFYDRMNDAEQDLYDGLYSECMRYLTGAGSFTYDTYGYYTDPVDYAGMDSGDACAVAEVFSLSNPQFYFLNEYISVQYGQDDSSGRVSLGVYGDFSDETARASATARFKDAVENDLSQIAGCTSAYEKERKAHDLIASHVSYGSSSYDQSCYSVFCGSKTVCSGYAEAMEMLCNASGIECLAISSEEHEWNEVRMDGTWYAVDVTWDDGDPVAHTYMNVSDDTLQRGTNRSMHEPKSLWDRFGRPVCSTDQTESADQEAGASADSGAKAGQNDASNTGNDARASAVTMYRLFYPGTQEHLYTSDTNERDYLLGHGWTSEGIAWYAPRVSATPVYRMFNRSTTDHLYTVDYNEYTVLQTRGWTAEGIAWYSDDNRTVPVYRQFTPYLVTGSHNYTTDVNEKNVIVASGAWYDEGIAWYAL